MDIIRSRQQKRSTQISELTASIEKSLEENKEVNYKQLVLGAQSNLGISDRTAKQYIDVALFNLGLDVEDLRYPSLLKINPKEKSSQEINEVDSKEMDDILEVSSSPNPLDKEVKPVDVGEIAKS